MEREGRTGLAKMAGTPPPKPTLSSVMGMLPSLGWAVGKSQVVTGWGLSPPHVLSVPLVSPFSGIWSNLYAASLQDSLYWASEPSQFWDRWAQDQANLGGCLGSL